jgi:hypothetical protein
LKTVKLASTKYLDDLPLTGGGDGHAFRDLGLEEEVFKLTQDLGRAIRRQILPRLYKVNMLILRLFHDAKFTGPNCGPSAERRSAWIMAQMDDCGRRSRLGEPIWRGEG